MHFNGVKLSQLVNLWLPGLLDATMLSTFVVLFVNNVLSSAPLEVPNFFLPPHQLEASLRAIRLAPSFSQTFSDLVSIWHQLYFWLLRVTWSLKLLPPLLPQGKLHVQMLSQNSFCAYEIFILKMFLWSFTVLLMFFWRGDWKLAVF